MKIWTKGQVWIAWIVVIALSMISFAVGIEDSEPILILAIPLLLICGLAFFRSGQKRKDKIGS